MSPQRQGPPPDALQPPLAEGLPLALGETAPRACDPTLRTATSTISFMSRHFSRIPMPHPRCTSRVMCSDCNPRRHARFTAKGQVDHQRQRLNLVRGLLPGDTVLTSTCPALLMVDAGPLRTDKSVPDCPAPCQPISLSLSLLSLCECKRWLLCDVVCPTLSDCHHYALPAPLARSQTLQVRQRQAER